MKAFVSHVQIPSNSVEDSVRWYEKHLGGQLVGHFGQFAIVELSEGATLNIWQTSDQTSNTFTVDGIPFPAIGIEVDEIEQLIASIIASGVDYEGDGTSVVDDEGRKFFRFFDPYGNMIVAHEESLMEDIEEANKE